MYTDGTIEARDRTGVLWRTASARSLLSVSGEGVSGICGKVLGELERFTESALDDDIALVSLEFLRGRS
ncbi:MAG: SpoIIE family protein phosphatase [Collinsella sp.]